MKKLIATAISDIRTDVNAREYKVITLQQNPRFVDAEGEVVTDTTRTKSLTYNAYAQTYLNNTQDPLWNVSLNGKVAGDIVFVEVPAYQIKERKGGKETGNMVTLTTSPVLVLGNSDNKEVFERSIARAQAQKIAQNEKYQLSIASLPGATVG